MSRFSDLLKAPLPSKQEDETYTTEAENVGMETNKAEIEAARKAIANQANAKANIQPAKEDGEDCVGPECDDVAPELQGIADEVDSEDPVDAVISDDIGADSDAIDQKIDDTIQRAATPILLGGELSGDEADNFIESVDCDAAVSEAFMTERTIVKFDKKARWSQLHKVAVLAIAKEKKDPMYKKLVTVWRIEKTLENRLTVKYGAQANARVRVYLQRARQSKSNPIKKAAAKLTSK